MWDWTDAEFKFRQRFASEMDSKFGCPMIGGMDGYGKVSKILSVELMMALEPMTLVPLLICD